MCVSLTGDPKGGRYALLSIGGYMYDDVGKGHAIGHYLLENSDYEVPFGTSVKIYKCKTDD